MNIMKKFAAYTQYLTVVLLAIFLLVDYAHGQIRYLSALDRPYNSTPVSNASFTSTMRTSSGNLASSNDLFDNPNKQAQGLLNTDDLGVHVVKKGENLYRIGKKYGMTVKELQDLNNLVGTTIHPGDELMISSGSRGLSAENIDGGNPIPEDDNLAIMEGFHESPQSLIESELELLSYQERFARPKRYGGVLNGNDNSVKRIETRGGEAFQIKDIKYTVQAGDDLFSIADYFETTVDNLRSLNNITFVRAGDVLIVGRQRIPVSTSAMNSSRNRGLVGNSVVSSKADNEYLSAKKNDNFFEPAPTQLQNAGNSIDDFGLGEGKNDLNDILGATPSTRGGAGSTMINSSAALGEEHLTPTRSLNYSYTPNYPQGAQYRSSGQSAGNLGGQDFANSIMGGVPGGTEGSTGTSAGAVGGGFTNDNFEAPYTNPSVSSRETGSFLHFDASTPQTRYYAIHPTLPPGKKVYMLLKDNNDQVRGNIEVTIVGKMRPKDGAIIGLSKACRDMLGKGAIDVTIVY